MKGSVLICLKRKDAAAQKAGDKLTHWLKSHEYPVLNVTETKGLVEIKSTKGVKLGVIIGGDGTFLSLARRLEKKDSFPLLGINLGSLGFITDTAEVDMISAVESALVKKPLEESRFLLDVELWRENRKVAQGSACNDAVLTKDAQTTMLKFDVKVGGEFLSSVRADGYIVATPTGSTAYNLSAGGPLLHPEVQSVVLVPLCSHALSSRPFVIPSHLEIEIHPKEFKGKVYLVFDGQVDFEVQVKDRILIRASKSKLRLVRTHTRQWSQALRLKLGMV